MYAFCDKGEGDQHIYLPRKSVAGTAGGSRGTYPDTSAAVVLFDLELGEWDQQLALHPPAMAGPDVRGGRF